MGYITVVVGIVMVITAIMVISIIVSLALLREINKLSSKIILNS